MFYFLFTDTPGSVSHTNKQWNILSPNITSQAVVDESNQASSLTVTVPGISLYPDLVTVSFPWTGTGDWYDEAVGDPAWINSSSYFTLATVNGLDSSKTYVIDFVGAYDAETGRVANIKINGGTEHSYPIANQPNIDSYPIQVSGSTSATIEVSRSVTGSSYLLGFRIYEYVEPPTLTITESELTPGGAISGTYSHYETVPTTLTVTDGTNTITIASPTITDNGDGTGSFSGTMPDLPTSGTANLILFGDVDVELS